MTRSILLVGVFVAVSLIYPSLASSAVWIQFGTPGQFPATAEITTGLGVIDAIEGKITAVDVVHMYQLSIPDPSLFSATSVGSGTDFIDTQLFLFDVNGIGVIGNDDTSPMETNATIPLGSLTGPAGPYYLAIVEFSDKPVSAGGKIFPDLFTIPPASSTDLVGPTGPGGSQAISGWDFDGFSETQFLPGPDDYRITLTGANFASQNQTVVPEPSTAALWLGLGLFLPWRRLAHRYGLASKDTPRSGQR